DLSEDLLGQKATLTLRRPHDPDNDREVTGILLAVEPLGPAESGDASHSLYRAELAPPLARLALVRRSRIFQDQSVRDIVDSLLEDAQIDREWVLAKDLPAREYCVQYQETDLAFLSRLLADEGVFYHVPVATGLLRLADSPDALAPLADPLPYCEPLAGAGQE